MDCSDDNSHYCNLRGFLAAVRWVRRVYGLEREMMYYVVEARLPVRVDDATTPEIAAVKARGLLEKKTGIDLGNWFLRVFEYGDDHLEVGPKEYFFSPDGSKARELKQNWQEHKEIIEKKEEK